MKNADLARKAVTIAARKAGASTKTPGPIVTCRAVTIPSGRLYVRKQKHPNKENDR